MTVYLIATVGSGNVVKVMADKEKAESFVENNNRFSTRQYYVKEMKVEE